MKKEMYLLADSELEAYRKICKMRDSNERNKSMKRSYFIRANSMAEAYRKACKLRDSEYYDYPASVTNAVEESILWNDYRMADFNEASKKLSDDEFEELMKKLTDIYTTKPETMLHKYLEWEGIFGYDDEIIEHYHEGDLADYLADEGIIGYDNDIRGILGAKGR